MPSFSSFAHDDVVVQNTSVIDLAFLDVSIEHIQLQCAMNHTARTLALPDILVAPSWSGFVIFVGCIFKHLFLWSFWAASGTATVVSMQAEYL